jgi:hypothetical protein
MKPVRVLLALAILPALAGLAYAGAKKQSAVNVRFYPEGGAEGGEFSQKVQLLNNPNRVTYMGEIPLISEREITAYYPFQVRDGSFGAYFKLDDHGTNLLAQHTMSKRGTYLFVFFNGRHVVDLAVDRPVQDGIAVIPSGLTSTDISLLDMTFPVMGQGGKKSGKGTTPKVAQQKPSATPKPASMPRMSPALVRQPDGSLAPATNHVPASGQPESPRPLNAIGQ